MSLVSGLYNQSLSIITNKQTSNETTKQLILAYLHNKTQTHNLLSTLSPSLTNQKPKMAADKTICCSSVAPKADAAHQGDSAPVDTSNYPPKACKCTKCSKDGSECGSGAEAATGKCKYCMNNCS